MDEHVDAPRAGMATAADIGQSMPPWWAAGLLGSLLVAGLSLVRLPLLLRGGGAPNYGWYTTASGNRLSGLIPDQVQYLQLTDHFAGRGPAPTVEPFTSRSLAPWIAGQFGGDAAVALWAVNAACLVLGTIALARLAMDLTGSRRWTLGAVLVWSLSWPVFWYTSKGLVDPAAVALTTCALLALRRRWLLPGLGLFVLAVWTKETALVLLPVAVTHELMAGTTPGRAIARMRAGSWVFAGGFAYLTAGWLVDEPDLTFAPWIPSSLPNALRMAAMNFSSTGFFQFAFTAAPALVALVLWWRSRRVGRPFIDDRDGTPLVIGIVAGVALSLWSFVSALWDGRTVWLTLPFGALLLAAWGREHEQERPRVSWRTAIRPVVFAGALAVGIAVLWVVTGALVNRAVTGHAAPALQGIVPRFAAQDLVTNPSGRTSFAGHADGTVDIDANGPVLLRFAADEPTRISTASGPVVDAAARSGTVLIDADGPTEVFLATDSAWTATVLRVDRALFWEGLSPVSSDGPYVLLFPGGLVNSVDMVLHGASDSSEVTAVGACRTDECPPLPSSEHGDVTVPAGTEALVIDTPSPWKLVPERLSDKEHAVVLEGTLTR